MKESVKIIATNRKARHDYFIDERYEAGMELKGTEVKSLRAAKTNLRDSYVQIKGGEAFVCNMHISPYEQGNINNTDPMRTRRLLLHKREIMKLMGQVQQKGFTLIPLSVYLKNGRMKLEIGLARGKKLFDKRADLKEKAVKRDNDRKYQIK
ncbi:MAG: SsrA-binding protein SmpB [Christensenellaceae bacterium]|nr:SsrA-binding protein SmpB [Christensenellaceae bacterium]